MKNSTHAALSRLDEELKASRDRLESVADALERFSRSGYIETVLERILADGVKPSMSSFHEVCDKRIRLLETPDHTVYLESVACRKPMLHTMPLDSVAKIYGRVPVHVRRYRIDQAFDPNVFAEGIPLSLESKHEIADGYLLQRRGEPYVHDLYSDAPFLVLEVSLMPADEQIWSFDRTTLCSTYAAFSSTTFSGLTMAARSVGAKREARLLPMLEMLAGHPSHAVRWTAIQAIGRIDGDIAVRHLRRATTDAHPHIRASASKILEKIDATQAAHA